jgi:hypothetical protein
MIRTLVLLAAGVSAVALAGCGPNVHFGPAVDIESRGAMKVISTLTCPKEQGHLKLISAAPDGRSCEYKGDDTEVTLRLLALNGDTPHSALTPIETELQALMPEMKNAGQTEDVSADQQSVDLPGVHIRANDHGAKVRVAGININANDDAAEIRIGQNDAADDSAGNKTVTIKSGDGDVQVDGDRSDRDDRGDRDDRRHRRRRGHSDDVSTLYMLASDKSTSGYRVVGYDAAGPKGGPLAVAIVKSRSSEDDEHRVFSDAKALVRLNVGGGGSHIRID